jgi:cell wall-associated NlpC family hydrolase
MLLTPEIQAQFEEYATLEEEQVAIVLKDGTFIPCENVVEQLELYNEQGERLTRKTDAVIDQDVLIEYDDEIALIIHSHWDEGTSGYLSFRDVEQSRFHQLPTAVYHTLFKTWDLFDPLGWHPYPLKATGNPKKINYYKNWPFFWGRSDCASLFRAYFHHMYGVDIPDYPRPTDGEWYKDLSRNDYIENIEKTGCFRRVNREPKKDDLVMIRYGGSINPAHAMVMVDNKNALHLLKPGHLSEVIPFGGAWKRGLHSVWELIN